MVKGLREPESEYVRDALQGMPWGQHEYILDLLTIETAALEPPDELEGMARYTRGRSGDIMRGRHPDEFFAILDELNPALADEHRRRLERGKNLREAREKEEQRRLEEDKALWLELGGAP